MSQPMTIGIDLGGTEIKYGLVDVRQQIIQERSRPTNVDQGPERVIANLVEVGRELMEFGDVVAVGIGSPGPLSPTSGIIYRSANLPGWENVPLRDRVSEALRRPVAMDNDANVAAYGEYKCGGGASDDMVLITLGTGVGTGAIVNGEILHGHFENASEWGHMIVAVDGRACNCGQRGCLESFASATGITKQISEAIQAGERTSLADVWTRKNSISTEDVTAAVQAGDILANRVWKIVCTYLAVACVNMQHALNPARIVLGGGMAASGSLLLEPVRSEFRRLTWKHDDAPVISLARLGNKAGLLGAAMLARQAVDS